MLKINFLKFTKYISGYKKMILKIHQPEYLPWMGFFNKLSYADVYVALDNVQYRHKYFQNRNKILTSNGECWLNVPVYRKGNRDIFIQDIKINNIINWRDKTWKNIYYSYKKAPYFKQYSDYFENVYSTEWENLVDINLDLIENICKFLNFKVDIVKASDLNIDGIGPELILDVCKLFKPDVYISGQSGIGGRGEDIDGNFEKEDIKVIYQNFKHPEYTTICKEFVPFMSIIDLLFNHGDDTINILKGDGGWYNA